MKALHILAAGNKLPSLANKPGDFHDWIIKGMQAHTMPVKIVNVRHGEQLHDIEQVSGVVITGSSSMVTDHEPWSERIAHWLEEATQHQIPVLGICYGHQLLAYALGGTVADNPAGIEVGTVETVLSADGREDVLLKGLLSPLKVQASHRQSVSQLPLHAVRLASSTMDKNHAFRVGTNAWGLQFHPEFDAETTKHYINYYRPQLESNGVNAEQLLRRCEDNGIGSLILQRFVKRVAANRAD
jgi:GMP synthase (glutamine-hydrolysing)